MNSRNSSRQQQQQGQRALTRSQPQSQLTRKFNFDSVRELMKASDEMGKWLYESGFGELKNPSQGKIIAFASLSDGKNPLTITSTNWVFMGHLSKKASAMRSEWIDLGGKLRWDEYTEESVTLSIWHKEHTDGKWISERVVLADFLKKKFTRTKDGKDLKDNWRDSALDMMVARATTRLFRRQFPQVTEHRYAPEEIMDMHDDPKHANAIETAFEVTPETAPIEENTQSEDPSPPSEPSNDTKTEAQPETQEQSDSDNHKDPSMQAFIEKMLDFFSGIGISREDLEFKLGERRKNFQPDGKTIDPICLSQLDKSDLEYFRGMKKMIIQTRRDCKNHPDKFRDALIQMFMLADDWQMEEVNENSSS